LSIIHLRHIVPFSRALHPGLLIRLPFTNIFFGDTMGHNVFRDGAQQRTLQIDHTDQEVVPRSGGDYASS
jgi:hypothetical protein